MNATRGTAHFVRRGVRSIWHTPAIYTPPQVTVDLIPHGRPRLIAFATPLQLFLHHSSTAIASTATRVLKTALKRSRNGTTGCGGNHYQLPIVPDPKMIDKLQLAKHFQKISSRDRMFYFSSIKVRRCNGRADRSSLTLLYLPLPLPASRWSTLPMMLVSNLLLFRLLRG